MVGHKANKQNNKYKYKSSENMYTWEGAKSQITDMRVLETVAVAMIGQSNSFYHKHNTLNDL